MFFISVPTKKLEYFNSHLNLNSSLNIKLISSYSQFLYKVSIIQDIICECNFSIHITDSVSKIVSLIFIQINLSIKILHI